VDVRKFSWLEAPAAVLRWDVVVGLLVGVPSDAWRAAVVIWRG